MEIVTERIVNSLRHAHSHPPNFSSCIAIKLWSNSPMRTRLQHLEFVSLEKSSGRQTWIELCMMYSSGTHCMGSQIVVDYKSSDFSTLAVLTRTARN